MDGAVLSAMFGYLGACGFGAVFLLSFYRKMPLGLGERTGASKKSNWIRRLSGRWVRRWVRITSLPLALVAVLIGWPGLVLFYAFLAISVGGTRLYQKRLSRQYDLWQQLGYDGPPALEEQARQLRHNTAKPLA